MPRNENTVAVASANTSPLDHLTAITAHHGWPNGSEGQERALWRHHRPPRPQVELRTYIELGIRLCA
jgi:hypothetical protein